MYFGSIRARVQVHSTCLPDRKEKTFVCTIKRRSAKKARRQMKIYRFSFSPAYAEIKNTKTRKLCKIQTGNAFNRFAY